MSVWGSSAGSLQNTSSGEQHDRVLEKNFFSYMEDGGEAESICGAGGYRGEGTEPWRRSSGGRRMSAVWARTLASPVGQPCGHHLSSRRWHTLFRAQERDEGWRRMCVPSTRRGSLELGEGLAFEDKAQATATLKCQGLVRRRRSCADSKKTATTATELEVGC